ncbi:MAG: methyltransferase domain-containing protein [Promethearchaeota archaeon]|nr:MAG: methyltransferase domain-containing protein [Candidatus Lokiarchaeota archaeon]
MALLPEDFILPELYYTEEVAEQYDRNTRIRKIQREMTFRALEILECRPPALILDVGCGTGHSMQAVMEKGFEVKGVDIANAMLSIARKKGLEVIQGDFTKQIPFDPNYFDYVISISTLQWIFHGFKPEEIYGNAKTTASEIFRVLKSGGQVILQFYPKNKEQLELAGKFFKNAHFNVIKIIDEPEIPKRRKVFLLCKKSLKREDLL